MCRAVCMHASGRGCPWPLAQPGLRVPVLHPLSPQDVEAAMRLPLAFVVLLLASAQALAEEVGATDDLSYWSDWSDGDQVKVSPGSRRSARRPRGGAGAGRGAGAGLHSRAGWGVHAESRPLSPRRRSCRCPWNTSCRGWPGDPGPSSSSASWASGMPVSGALGSLLLAYLFS